MSQVGQFQTLIKPNCSGEIFLPATLDSTHTVVIEVTAVLLAQLEKNTEIESISMKMYF